MIPLARPRFSQADLDAVARVLDSGMLVQGERVAAFEEGLAERTSRRFAVAVSSGTAALELGLTALGVGPGDEVLCPALTWPSPAHAVQRVGARVVLVDVDASDWNGDPARYSDARTGRTKLAIVIDQFGNPVRRAALRAALGDLPILEDAACGLGSHFEDGPCGSFGAISTLSFHPRKILTTGEGGACLTDDPALAERLRVLRNHGQAGPGEFVESAGNHRLTELAAALGLGQLARLDVMLEQRAKLAARYELGFASLGAQLRSQRVPEGCRTNRQTVGVVLGQNCARPALVLERLRERGVGAGRLSYDLSLVPYFEALARASVAAEIQERGIALPLFEDMQPEQVDEVLEALAESIEP